VPVADQWGPGQIRAQARPDLCWQAAGNGSPVTLAHCGSVSGQLWTLTGNGVLMNGNGYCLQASPSAAGGLLIGFGGQCDGETGQLWAYRSPAGQLASVGTGAGGGAGNCAVLSGPLAPGAPVVSGACAGGTRWAFGAAAVAPARSARPRPRATPHRVVVHAATAPPVTAAQPAGVWSGLPLAILLAGLLVVTGTALVLFGRRSRKATRPRPEPYPGLDRTADDDGPYVVDVPDEVTRRRASQEVVDTRPTMPFDTRSLL
jgi:hypothetical protein